MGNGNLKLAARFVQADFACHFDVRAFLQRHRQPLGGEFEHHAAHLRGAVFERKIIVAAGGAGQVGHFARHPQAGKTALQQLARQGVEFGHRQRGGGKQFGHGALRKKKRDYSPMPVFSGSLKAVGGHFSGCLKDWIVDCGGSAAPICCHLFPSIG